MNISVNGQSQVPPGFRFHPTEEELLHYYLRKKIANDKIDLDVIQEVDLNKLEPWDIQEKCKIGSTPQNDWYLFSHKDKKYPSGSRTNRATAAGFWKATGRDKVIYGNCKRIGMRKTLVFYKGRAPHGLKLDWIMHEYRLDDTFMPQDQAALNFCASESTADPEGGWVVCRVFKKKSGIQSSSAVSKTLVDHENPNTHDGVLDKILMYMGKSSKQQKQETNSSNIIQQIKNNNNNNTDNRNIRFDNIDDSFLHLPDLVNHHDHQDCSSFDEMITMSTETDDRHYSCMINHFQENEEADKKTDPSCDWLALMASQLTGHLEIPTNNNTTRSNDDDVEFWSYAQSSNFDPLSQFSV